MKLNLKQIYESVEVLKKISNKELPFVTSFKILRILNVIASPFNDFEKVRNNLIRRFGKAKEDKSDMLEVSPENIEAYYNELSKLFVQEVEVEFELLKPSELESISISPAELFRIQFCITV